ncbi:MFS transporter [Williamsia sp. MIQD14]|uniref:MFS transporter n=1 Tax=Williamsia sp. MIQD14 TaxID=3425703 RepID=UPI003D9FE277
MSVAEKSTGAERSRLPRALVPLARRQYRLLAMGLVLATFADGIWTVGVVWQVIALGGGPGALSAITTLAAVGMVVSTLFGGVLADRMSQRTILIALEVVKLVAIGGVGLLGVTGNLGVGALAVVGLIGGVTTGIYYPAYSALVPRVVPSAELLAVNGFEGTLRPVVFQAAGPALAGGLIAISAPPAAILGSAVASALSAVFYLRMRPVPVDGVTVDREADDRHPLRRTVAEIAEGFGYMWRTLWLSATLLFALILVMMTAGPLEVLVPFAIKDRAGGDAGSHAMVLAAFGVGGALGSLFMASRPMPRRYLTIMFVVWGLSGLPLIAFAFADRVVMFVVAAFVMGITFDAPMVLWGTLLQRRVPPELLGRVSSLDFFVSVAFMPVSMALAAPVAGALGLTTTFLLAAVIPIPVAVIAYVAARLDRDEIAHPLR